jgi:hypothetical protein
MKTVAVILSAALVAGLAAAASAQQPVAKPGDVFALPPKERYAATDKNKDGKVTKDEFVVVIQPDAKPFIDAIFDNRDSDKSGWLTEAEMNANGGGRAGRGGAAAAAAAGRGGAAQAKAGEAK